MVVVVVMVLIPCQTLTFSYAATPAWNLFYSGIFRLKVYREPLCRRYYATPCSFACIYCTGALVTLLLVPFFMAYDPYSECCKRQGNLVCSTLKRSNVLRNPSRRYTTTPAFAMSSKDNDDILCILCSRGDPKHPCIIMTGETL